MGQLINLFFFQSKVRTKRMNQLRFQDQIQNQQKIQRDPKKPSQAKKLLKKIQKLQIQRNPGKSRKIQGNPGKSREIQKLKIPNLILQNNLILQTHQNLWCHQNRL